MLPCLFFCGFFPKALAAGRHQDRRRLVLKARASPRQALSSGSGGGQALTVQASPQAPLRARFAHP